MLFFSSKKLQCFVCYWKRSSKEEEDDDTEERGEVLETKFLVSQRDSASSTQEMGLSLVRSLLGI